MRKISVVSACCCLAIAVAIAPAFGQSTKQKAAAPKSTEQAAATGAAAPAAEASTVKALVEGFRSAKFGMNETDVRSAITKDFALKPDAIKRQDNPAELTNSVMVSVPDLL